MWRGFMQRATLLTKFIAKQSPQPALDAWQPWMLKSTWRNTQLKQMNKKPLLQNDARDTLLTSVSCRVERQTGIITLDRPQTLNALDVDMIQTIQEHLQLWRTDAAVTMVIIESGNDKAFCAGGDLRSLYKALAAQEFSGIE